jgi:hypothetical protein
MSTFDIDVTRDGGWWMVHIPKLGGRTPARYPSEVEPMAREYIAVSTGTPIDQVAINWRRCTLVTPEGWEPSRIRCMELTEALVTEDITPFERERLREALEEEVRRQLPTDRRLVRVVDWDPGGGHAVENAPGMRKYRVAYETEPRD